MEGNTIITAVITGLLTWLATRTKSQYDVKKQKVESTSNTEGMYVQNMSAILEEYKEQVSGFRDEVRKLRKENAEIKKEFEEFKQEHYRKIQEYKKYSGLLEQEIEDLKEENTDLKLELSYLKGEKE